MNIIELKNSIFSGGMDDILSALYGGESLKRQTARYLELIGLFSETFGGGGNDLELFSAPGRIELCGNHTDHNHGKVLAAAVNLDIIAAVSKRCNNDGVIRIKSYGYDAFEVDLSDLETRACEMGSTQAIVRGVASGFVKHGFNIGGFDACVMSDVPKGAGLSSSAAFEVLLGTIFNHLYNGGKILPIVIAKIGQFSENKYFGKPCGLMDQAASACGGISYIDFYDAENPHIEKIDFNFKESGYSIIVVDTGKGHADLTDDYADIVNEMRSAAAVLGREFLEDVTADEIIKNSGEIREKCGDRALLRTLHFANENERVCEASLSLKQGKLDHFLSLITASGKSSFEYLQNVYSNKNPSEQSLSVALCLAENLLSGRGAFRVHGGGFAGTTLNFVPDDMTAEFICTMENVFGTGCCHILSVRSQGGVCIQLM